MSEFIQEVTSLIEELWSRGDLTGYFGAAVLVLIILVVAVVLGIALLGFIGWLAGRVVWYIKRRHCSHCGAWTTHDGEGKYAECPTWKSCCASCTFQHFMDHEPHVNCPKCGLMMVKRNIRNKLAIDVCTKHGVWLDLDELETLEGDARQNGYSVGHSDGLAVGIIIS